MRVCAGVRVWRWIIIGGVDKSWYRCGWKVTSEVNEGKMVRHRRCDYWSSDRSSYLYMTLETMEWLSK